MTAHISLQNVSKQFKEGSTHRQVLAEANMSIERGTMVAIRGRSGSGKTTVLNLIAGLDLADGGTVRIEGENIQSLNDRERTLLRRRRCGFVFQFFNLVPTLNARENVLISLELNGFGATRAARRAAELLESVGLGDRGHGFPDQLSGGEQQRVALARALAHEPGLLLADEPTGNLDAATELEILALIRALPRARGTTVLIATHSDLVASYADRVLALAAGMLSEQ